MVNQDMLSKFQGRLFQYKMYLRLLILEPCHRRSREVFSSAIKLSENSQSSVNQPQFLSLQLKNKIPILIKEGETTRRLTKYGGVIFKTQVARKFIHKQPNNDRNANRFCPPDQKQSFVVNTCHVAGKLLVCDWLNLRGHLTSAIFS